MKIILIKMTLLEKELIKQYINFEDENLLIKHCELGNYNIVKYLINNEYDVNFSDSNGWSCLTYALFNKNIKLIKLLLCNGALRNIDDCDFQPLSSALMFGCDIKIIKILIEHGCNVNWMENLNGLPFMYLLKNYKTENNFIDFIKLFLINNVNIFLVDKVLNESPINYVFNNKMYDIFELFIIYNTGYIIEINTTNTEEINKLLSILQKYKIKYNINCDNKKRNLIIETQRSNKKRKITKPKLKRKNN